MNLFSNDPMINILGIGIVILAVALILVVREILRSLATSQRNASLESWTLHINYTPAQGEIPTSETIRDLASEDACRAIVNKRIGELRKTGGRVRGATAYGPGVTRDLA